jgi:hypothetical protein
MAGDLPVDAEKMLEIIENSAWIPKKEVDEEKQQVT